MRFKKKRPFVNYRRLKSSGPCALDLFKSLKNKKPVSKSKDTGYKLPVFFPCPSTGDMILSNHTLTAGSHSL